MAPPHHPPPLPDLPCPYRAHLYQVMQLCWNPSADARPSASQVQLLLQHLHSTHARPQGAPGAFEERWQRLKPNHIPVVDQHRAQVHVPTRDAPAPVSRSSSIMSDRDPLAAQIKSESLTNLHGSLEDVRNIYLTHNETPLLECHQGNVSLDDDHDHDRDHDRSDSSMDPWLKDIVAGSQDDVSYYRDVSDVIKNLDNILNSEKTSSSESSHQASPSRDNLSLDCKKDYPIQSSMVKSPGISNFQNILEAGLVADEPAKEPCEDDDADRDTIGTLSHSFERHSDTLSQQTLENVTPETPIKDLDVVCRVDDRIENLPRDDLENVSDKIIDETKRPPPDDVDLPNENKLVSSDSKIPELKELCVASISSVSEKNIELPNGTQDCLRSCDNNLAEERTDNEIETKSIDDVEKCNTDSTSVEKTIESDAILKFEEVEIDNVDLVLPKPVSEAPTEVTEEATIADVAPLPTSEPKSEEDITLVSDLPTSENMDVEVFNGATVTSDLNLPVEIIFDSPSESKTVTDSSKDATNSEATESENAMEPVFIPQLTAPEAVQNIVHSNEAPDFIVIQEAEISPAQIVTEDISTPPISPEIVQTNDNEKPIDDLKIQSSDASKEEAIVLPRSEQTEIRKDMITEQSNDSTVYMDLINATNETVKEKTIDDNMKELIKSCIEKSIADSTSCIDNSVADSTCALVKNESTVYMDLPSMIKETDNFLQSERVVGRQNIPPFADMCSSTPIQSEKIVGSQNVPYADMCSSTPIASDQSTDDTLENSVKAVENELLSETKVPEVPDYGPGVTLTKLEQRCVPESMSPFESPTKSHHTDTYDENSSVVLGPFENCTLEIFKGAKSIDPVDLPREELLAFSSNFSEMNLETPSPLRDVNFLNEVPDILHDDIQFDDLELLSEPIDKSEPQSSNETDPQSATEKRVSPLTPPNSPGTFLASTSQQKYVVDIDLDPPMGPSNMELDTGLPKEVDLNQIELQITTKLAMAENENNLNIEYSGPLVVEGVAPDDMMLHDETDAVQESYLAGNGGSSPRAVELDEECVKALRNELELKLPLAQVANIEPACPAEWSGSLPPPPELVLSYPGALSPIAEETRQQLSAYESDAHWNNSTRTDSSESYPEPCNNSTDEVTDLPTGLPSGLDHSTYTVHSRERSPDHSPDRSRGHSPDRTYTVQKDATTSRDITMSADSLNASPYKKPAHESPIDDRTYNKNEEEKESRCERISQVSPFILSPTTDSSAPENSDYVDNATGISNLSKTTVPTDAKSSKPSETQCLSKATSIDSWCSNDTLYNVEENFDDLAMDPDLPVDFELQKEDENSESSDTLTHNDEDKELSHCSTYIVHDSKSEPCETFSPDSITANDNYTYTKARTDAAPTATPSVNTKSEVDSAKNTQTKDLAYGTLMSGLPSYSNCTTEVASGFDDVWKLSQPEMVRRSPVMDEINITPPKFPEEKEPVVPDSPQLPAQPCLKKMDSVEISCLHDNLIDTQIKIESPESRNLVEISDSPNYQYKSMEPSVTSTPLTEPAEGDNVEAIPMPLPDSTRTPELLNNIPNFQTFLQSAEVRPQDISPSDAASNQDTEILLEGDSKTLSRISNRDSLAITDRTPNYSDFENSAISKPQDVNSRDKSSQSLELGTTVNSEDFRNFESSVRSRPQDLSSVIDASSLLLNSERRFSDLVITNSTGNVDSEQTSQSGSRVNDIDPIKSLDVSPPNVTNLIESHELGNVGTPSNFYLDMEAEDETEQPHSIIITERDVLKESPNRTFDSHEAPLDLNHTYDSHESRSQQKPENDSHHHRVNGIDKNDDVIECDKKSPKVEDLLKQVEPKSPKEEIRESLTVLPSVVTEDSSNKSGSSPVVINEEIKCNGNSEKFATVQFLHETFEELIESNVDDGDCKDFKSDDFTEDSPSQNSEGKSAESTEPICSPAKVHDTSKERSPQNEVDVEEAEEVKTNGVQEVEEMTSVTENFLQNEKKFCQLDSYFPLLSDIRFTGPAAEIMSTSFSQDSPSSPASPARDPSRPDAADLLKEWDSDSDSHSTNSSSGEFIWKDGDGHETPLVPSTQFDHQRGGSGQPNGGEGNSHADRGEGSGGSEGSGDSGSGSEGDEVEFVPSSWDCRAAPSKSSLRSLEQATPDNKKRVVFKRQKYHCVYEYPREAPDAHSPAAYVPDLSTYTDWDPSSAEEAELGYGQLFGAPNPLDMYPLRSSIAFDYDEDFFISSSTRPFESLGIMSTTSQFFPGMHAKAALERRAPPDLPPDLPPSVLHHATPSLDFTTPDSGVEDITPGSLADDDFKKPPLSPAPAPPACWPASDSASSSESVSPSSPGALGGLRHTRATLKLDLPPSPRLPSPRHARAFSFVLDPPKPRADPASSAPLVMTDDTPVVATALPIPRDDAELPLPIPEPTFSTFGKSVPKPEPEPKAIILTDEAPDAAPAPADSPRALEPVKGEGTVLDSGDEDSGIESSSKATLERNKTTPNVS
ncbi:uncharacterized protein LOC114360664 [Ostrinia furnacalis]|uniref:uncharacterized protein LOC114360664 n=1 Tax=Ostrinia furnacalis TaxID=93504 RepID=UPI001038AC5D|nr:uncharacterized protein LOC114360664 [Ostrinia furnacalis]